MSHFYRFFALIIFILLSNWVRADSFLNFIHITCIKDARYLSFEEKSVQVSYALMETEFNDVERKERMKLWKQQGYYSPSNLTFECRMPESTYTIIATQPKPSNQGLCGGTPSTTLSLLRNGKPFLKDVTFGSGCIGEPFVQRVELSDGLEGWNKREMTVCVSPRVGSCEFLSESYDAISKAVPIDKNKIVIFSNKGKK